MPSISRSSNRLSVPGSICPLGKGGGRGGKRGRFDGRGRGIGSWRQSLTTDKPRSRALTAADSDLAPDLISRSHVRANVPRRDRQRVLHRLFLLPFRIRLACRGLSSALAIRPPTAGPGDRIASATGDSVVVSGEGLGVALATQVRYPIAKARTAEAAPAMEHGTWESAAPTSQRRAVRRESHQFILVSDRLPLPIPAAMPLQ